MPIHPSPDVAVIGGGAAGLTAAALSSMLGARTMLIEKGRLGGDCTWTGCIPSKTLLDAARRWKTAAEERGMPTTDEHERAFCRAMDRVRATREAVYRHADTPERFESMGVDVRFGEARFTDQRQVRIHAGHESIDIRPRYVMVATGSRPVVPPVPGLQDIGFLTNETIFDLKSRPGSLAVIGGGPTGVELSQAFARFGVRVTILERENSILQSFHAPHVEVLATRLREEGVTIRTSARVQRIESLRAGVLISLDDGTSLEAEKVLVAAGRVARTEAIGLDAAGVRIVDGLVDIDGSCRTNLAHVYGIGDVATHSRFTHTAGEMARTAVLRALYKVPGSYEDAGRPAVVYTDPGIGIVGRSGTDSSKNPAHHARVSMDRVDRALVDGESRGEILLSSSRTGRIRAASILAADAGELTGLAAALIGTGAGIRRLSGAVFPYPTYAEAFGRAASRSIAARVPDGIIRLAARVMGLRGVHAGLDPEQIA